MVKMNILNRTSHGKKFLNMFAMIIFALLLSFLNFSCKIDWFSDFDKIRKDELSTNFYFYNEEDSINSENNIVQGAFFSRNYEIGLELTASSFPDGTYFSSYSSGKTLLGWKFYRKTGDKTTEIPSSVELNAEGYVENVKVGAISYDFVAVWKNTLPEPEPEPEPVVNEANYKVQHLRQKLSDDKTSAIDEYEIFETETKVGTIGKETSASAKNYEGFTAELFAQEIISAEGTTIVQIKYNRISYKIRFDINGGESGSISDIPAVYGGEYTIPENTFTAKNGFKASLNTWNSSSYGSGLIYKSGTTVSNLSSTDRDVVTLYAVWIKINSHSISYHDFEGTLISGLSPTSFDETEDVDLSTAITNRTGFTFKGWSENMEPIDSTSFTLIPGWNAGEKTSDVVVYAVWSENSYIITFDKNADDATGTMTNLSVKYTKKTVLPENVFARAGYVFAGWSISKTADAPDYVDKTTVSNLSSTDGGVVTLYAVWEKLPSGSGSTENPFDNETRFTSTDCSALSYGLENKIQIKAEATSGKAISWGIITVYDSTGVGITDSNYVVIEKTEGTGVTSGSSNETCTITFTKLMSPGTYFINVNAIVSGITYSDTITAKVLK